MRWLRISCLLLASLLPLSAEDWTTEDGKTYKNVTVLGQEDDGVRITFDGGAGKIPYYELPVDIQKRYGQDVESLAAKKQAVDKAIEDAVKSAAAAEMGKQPVEPGDVVMPSANPSVAPGANPNGGTVAAPGASGVTPGPVPGAVSGVVSPSANAAPGTTASGMVSPSGAPAPGTMAPGGTASGVTSPAGTPTAANGVKPGTPATNAAPGAQASGAPRTNAPAAAGGPAPSEGMPDLAGPITHAPPPTGVNGVTGAGGKPLELTVSKYTYNSSLDVCYLDSPPVDAFQDPPPKMPSAGQGSSLVLRVVTDGRQPQVPDRFEATFLSVGGAGTDISAQSIFFSPDDAQIAIDDTAKKDSGVLSGGGQGVQYISFYLTFDQARQICTAKALNFNIGGNHYKIDEKGAAILHNYMADVDGLAPASSSFVRSFYKMLARIPSFFSIISTICEYVIVGSFALLVAASIAAFILGVTRFIKM